MKTTELREYRFKAPKCLMDEYDSAAKAAGYNSRSDAIRAALQKHIVYMRRQSR